MILNAKIPDAMAKKMQAQTGISELDYRTALAYSVISTGIKKGDANALRVIAEERASKKHDYLVFMHADVSFNTRSCIEHLKDVGSKYAVIGLCGTSTFNVSQSPLNWWTGSNPTPYEKWGCVTHGELGDQTSYFSEHSQNVMDREAPCIE